MSSNERVRLRYTGGHPTTFTHHGIGEVEPGAEFEVPAADAGRYTRRADVEPVTASGKRKPKGAAAQADGGADGAEGAEGE